jgi:FkbM family methyltransferase
LLFIELTRVNVDTDWIDEEEKERRRLFHALEPPLSSGPDPSVYEFTFSNGRAFKMKKPDWDAKGAIEGQMVEEDMRQRFFYPHIGPLFFDVGACHGSWTLPALALGARVFAFEPDPRYMDSLEASVSINPGFRDRVTLCENGIVHVEARGNFFELEDVPFTTIDRIVDQFRVVPSFIKIDVEGMELHVLRGAAKTIELLHPKIFIENHLGSEGERDLRELLSSYQFIVGRSEEAFTYLFFNV